jgi:hypothetical protein
VQGALPLETDAPDPADDDARHAREGAVARRVEEVRQRYGDDSVVPARLVDPPVEPHSGTMR